MSLTIKAGGDDVVRFLMKRAELVRHLEVEDVSQLSEDTTKKIGGRLKRLNKLCLTNKAGGVVSPQVLTSLSSTFRAAPLNDLTLFNFSTVQDVTMTSMLHNLSALSTINLSNCSLLSDATLMALSRNCPKLVSVAFRATRISDSGLTYLGDECGGLLSIDFGECAGISDTGVQSVANQNASLKTAILDRCEHVTEQSLFTLASQCSDLTEINLDHTAVKRIPYMVVNLKHLQKLNVDNCDVVYPPPHVFDNGSIQKLQDFYKDYNLATRVKLFVMGDPGVGKSTVISALTHNQTEPVDSSCGIPVLHWQPFRCHDGAQTINPQLDNLHLEIWELPDHPVQQGIGELFYTQSAMYLVVCNLSDTAKDGSINSVPKYVATILAQVPTARVFVAATRLDRVPSLHVRQQRLKHLKAELRRCEELRQRLCRSYAAALDTGADFTRHHAAELTALGEETSHITLHAISCSTRKGVSDLREAMLEECRTFNEQHQPSQFISPGMLQFYDELITLRTAECVDSRLLVTEAEWANLAERMQLPNAAVDTRFLHDIGAVFDFTAITARLGYFCINPAVLLKLIVRLYSFQNVDVFTLLGTEVSDEEETSLRRQVVDELADRGIIPAAVLPRLWQSVISTVDTESLTRLLSQLGLLSLHHLPGPTPDFTLAPSYYTLDEEPSVFYSLPLLGRYRRTPPEVRWCSELPADDAQLTISVHLPGLVLLENFISRLLPAFCHDFADLTYWDVTQNTALLCFAQVSVLLCYDNSDCLTLTSRLNSELFPFGSQLLTLLELWSHAIAAVKTLERWLSLIPGIPKNWTFELRGPGDLEQLSGSQFNLLGLWSSWLEGLEKISANNSQCQVAVSTLFPFDCDLIRDHLQPDSFTSLLAALSEHCCQPLKSYTCDVADQEILELVAEQPEVISGGCWLKERGRQKVVQWCVGRRAKVPPATPLAPSLNFTPRRNVQENRVFELPQRIPLLQRQSQLSFSEVQLDSVGPTGSSTGPTGSAGGLKGSAGAPSYLSHQCLDSSGYISSQQTTPISSGGLLMTSRHSRSHSQRHARDEEVDISRGSPASSCESVGDSMRRSSLNSDDSQFSSRHSSGADLVHTASLRTSGIGSPRLSSVSPLIETDHLYGRGAPSRPKSRSSPRHTQASPRHTQASPRHAAAENATRVAAAQANLNDFGPGPQLPISRSESDGADTEQDNTIIALRSRAAEMVVSVVASAAAEMAGGRATHLPSASPQLHSTPPDTPSPILRRRNSSTRGSTSSRDMGIQTSTVLSSTMNTSMTQEMVTKTLDTSMTQEMVTKTLDSPSAQRLNGAGTTGGAVLPTSSPAVPVNINADKSANQRSDSSQPRSEPITLNAIMERKKKKKKKRSQCLCS